MTLTLMCWDILDKDLKQVGATDRLAHAEAQWRKGYGLLVHTTVIDVAGGKVAVLWSKAEYLGPEAKESEA